jgi:ribosomal protein S18 acetylase RimI-like enzyme
MSYPDVTGWSIRDGRCEDAEAVLELWRRAAATPSVTDTPEELRRAVMHGGTWVLLAEAGEQLIGSIIGTFDGWRGNIYRLAVHPEHRRLGIARALVAEVERRLREVGAKRITALVEKDHSGAVGFWEAAGYESDRRIARYVRSL